MRHRRPSEVQCDAQGAILEVNQGHPSCTRPTFAGSNTHRGDRDKPALGPATDPLFSIPILLQQRRSVGCFTYWCWFRPSPPRSRFAPTRSSSPMRERRGSMPRSCPSSRWRTGAGGCIATSCGVREPFAGVLPLLHPLRDAGRADGSPADAGDRVCAAQRAGPRLRAAMVPGRRAARGSRVTEDRRSLRSASTLAVAGCRRRRSSLIGRAVPSRHRP